MKPGCPASTAIALGINTINTWVTFAIPFYYNANPLLITPGFQLYLWDGPDATGNPPPTLPGSTYGAYLDAAWSPQINNWFGAELEVSPGVYTDFKHTTSESLRVLGRGLAVFSLTDTLKFKFGIWYIDRLEIKLLPAVGFVCTPNPDSRYEIFFPRRNWHIAVGRSAITMFGHTFVASTAVAHGRRSARPAEHKWARSMTSSNTAIFAWRLVPTFCRKRNTDYAAISKWATCSSVTWCSAVACPTKRI